MLIEAVITLSLLLWFASAFAAFRLIKITGYRLAWILISLAISVLTVRRGISAYWFMVGNKLQFDFSFELIGLVTAILVLAGVLLIGPLFKGMADEIVHRQEAEAAWRASEKKLRSITANIGEGIYVLDQNGRMVFMNPEAERLLGWTMAEMNERGPHELVHFRRPDGSPLPFAECRMHGVIAAGTRFYSTDEVFVRKDGTVFPIAVITAPIMEGGEVDASVTAFQDITELKLKDEQLKKSLAEKDILLREIHHRVKNNMLVISSLLRVQSGFLTDPKAIEIFREGQSRIRTMMMIYEKLYRSPDLTRVDYGSYLADLITGLFNAYNIHPDRIGLELDIAGVDVDIETAIPCGLIINELVSNSIKYGFPEGRRGKITVVMRRQTGETQLTVRDDGIGLPAEVDIAEARTFGLQLVAMMVRQLKGDYSLDRPPAGGTEFTIRFRKGGNG